VTDFLDRFGVVLRDHGPELFLRLGQHLELVGISLILAIGIGFGLGLLVAPHRRLSRIALMTANAVQTIPSLALLAFLLPLLGIGAKPAICALALYAIMPILRNTLAVLQDEARGLAAIGVALGLRPREILWRIKIPQGAPLLLSGLRTAAVWSVGTATLSAFIGAGGLGEFINRGISLLDPALLLLGAVPAALLALGIDLLLGALEEDARVWRDGHRFPKRKWLVTGLLLGTLVLGVIVGSGAGPTIADVSGSAARTSSSPVRIGTKNFAEQLVLGELIAQYLEANGVAVQRPLPAFQSTELIHEALAKGDIDLYVEYLGTAQQSILKLPPSSGTDPMTAVREAYETQFHLAWLEALGFSNTYAVITRAEVAGDATSLSSFVVRARQLHLGVNSEFIGRADGLPALEKTYGIQFARVETLDVGLLYPALRGGQVDAIVGFSTDGLLAQPGLVVLRDDLAAFPRYDAVPVASDAVLNDHPSLKHLLDGLAGRFDEATMRRLNAEMELQFRSPVEVAREYWQAHPSAPRSQ
jgi:osmoprotectant transport system permease protein